MRNSLLLVLFLPMLAFTCKKGNSKVCYQGKVIRTSCANVVVQVLNNDKLGEDGWKDIVSGATFDNVFTIKNRCQVQGSFTEGALLDFKIIEYKPDECVTCMLYDAPPGVAYAIESCETN